MRVDRGTISQLESSRDKNAAVVLAVIMGRGEKNLLTTINNNINSDPGSMMIFFFPTILLSRFWTSRGHSCCPLSPPVLAFNFYRA